MQTIEYIPENADSWLIKCNGIAMQRSAKEMRDLRAKYTEEGVKNYFIRVAGGQEVEIGGIASLVRARIRK